MNSGAGVKKGDPYLCLQCANLNNYCVLIKDNRSPEFDFFDPSRQLYIFNTNGNDLKGYNDSIKLQAASMVPPAPATLLDTDDEDVSNFRFIPNI